MAKIELEITEAALRRAQEVAAARNESVEYVLSELIDTKLAPPARRPAEIIGSWAEDAELLDQIVAEAMESRRRSWSRGPRA